MQQEPRLNEAGYDLTLVMGQSDGIHLPALFTTILSQLCEVPRGPLRVQLLIHMLRFSPSAKAKASSQPDGQLSSWIERVSNASTAANNALAQPNPR